MRIVLVLLLVAILATAAPPEKQKTSSKASNTANDAPSKAKKAVIFKKLTPKGNATEESSTDNYNGTGIDYSGGKVYSDYSYDSTWSFKCRQTNPAEYELECRIANADGSPGFPNLVKLIEVAAPLSTITYPIHSLTAQEAARTIEDTPTIVTVENIEEISLHAPFERIPAVAFASLPRLKKITLESLDGVRSVIIDKNAFKNTTAKHLHLAGYDIRYILDQDVDLHYFNIVTFSDVQIDCYHDFPKGDDKVSFRNVSCNKVFHDLKSVEELHLESIYVKGDTLDQGVFKPMWDTLKKLTVDVVFKRTSEKEPEFFAYRANVSESEYNETSENPSVPITQHHGYFPVETFAFMTKLEDMELYLYEPIVGLSLKNDTAIPLPVATTLTRLVLSCRYCRDVSMKELGKMLPNLRHLTIAAPLEVRILTDVCLKSFTKLEELIIYDGGLRGIKEGAFHSTPALKRLSINYASIEEIKAEHLVGLEATLENLAIVGTPIKYINVSSLNRLDSLDISQNQLLTIERSMLPEKAQLSNLDLSYNPIREVERGFLRGIEMKNNAIRIHGWDMESFDFNALEGVEKLKVLDLTQNLKLKKLEVSDYTKLPEDLERIIVGRSPYLKLEDVSRNLSSMLIEHNITLVIEGKVACCCGMFSMFGQLEAHLVEMVRSRALCSREGTVVDGTIPDTFWKNSTVINFLNILTEDKASTICKIDDTKRSKNTKFWWLLVG